VPSSSAVTFFRHVGIRLPRDSASYSDKDVILSYGAAKTSGLAMHWLDL